MRAILFCLILVPIMLACGTGRNKNRAAAYNRPNIVIIFIDDMGFGDVSSYGNKLCSTPRMDELAEKGTRFTQFYVNSPICSPSRVALNTGCYPMRFRIHSFIASSEANSRRSMADFLDPKVHTLARALQQNGYATGHFGKWHMGGGRDIGQVPLPSEYGFDKSLVSFEGTGDRVLFTGQGLSEQSARLGRGKIIWSPKNRSTSIYVDSALAFAARNADRPIFIQLCPNDVHDPHLPDSLHLAPFLSVTDNPWEQKFLAVLAELDRQIGRFIDGLAELGVMENTLLILTSDNGPTDWPYYYQPERYPEGYNGKFEPPGSTGGLYGRKWSLYEGGIRMPFIIRWDGHIPAGATDGVSLVTAMDLFPSILAILGIDPPSGLDGLDCSGALLGEPEKRQGDVMWEYASNPGGSILPGNKDYRSPCLAIRHDSWKLLIDTDSTGIRLFDLETDPGETRNLADSKNEIVGELATRVLQWRRAMPVPLPDADR